MSHRDAARARWRADLHEYGAAALRSAGLDAMAEDSDTEVAYQRAYADLMIELATAKGAVAEDRSPATLAVLKDVKTRLDAFRVSGSSGHRPAPGIVNNISEPSDAELSEMGY